MNVYYFFDAESNDETIAKYEWNEDGNLFYLDAYLFDIGKLEFVQNKDTKAGSVNYFVEDALIYEISWDAVGNGDYVYYDSEGNVTDSGSWSV